MSNPLSTSCIVWMTFASQRSAERVRDLIRQQRCYCLPIEKMEVEGMELGYTFGFVNSSSTLSEAQQAVLQKFGATDIEIYPLNMRRDYENYCHTLYYNHSDYEQMDTDMGYLIEADIDKNVMVFEEPEQSAYTWRVVFCTSEEIPQAQKDCIMATINPVAWIWNEPVTGDVSPTSIFK